MRGTNGQVPAKARRFREIPYSTEQGILFAEQGIEIGQQGIRIRLSGNLAQGLFLGPRLQRAHRVSASGLVAIVFLVRR